MDGNGKAAAGRVLVVDDDAAIRRSLERGLRLSGFTVVLAEDGRTALRRLTEAPADVVVLDVSMPGMSGTEVCRTLRAARDDTPVLMLSALDELADRVAGLQAGADDYLVKPFALEELVLRLHALLRRRPAPPGDRLRAGPLTIDPATRQARWDDRELRLTRREFELLTHLARNAGIVLSRDQLLDRVWGYDFEVRTDAVDTFVSYLRRKLEEGGRPRIIHTVRGVGFVLRLPAGHPAPDSPAPHSPAPRNPAPGGQA
ncbi:response regulator transcription factor [Kitasatospora sp. NPDC048540]|uniref:response regulator transcription factor n=1 Tax=Kitasatospora sp. NPDC048540 TaxID=3155634 RepID=UPI00341193A2